MKLTLNTLRQSIRRAIAPRMAPGLDPNAIKRMARGILTTRPDEIACGECLERMDLLAERTLAGRSRLDGPALDKAVRLVQDHLARCGDCQEEYQGLLRALQAGV